MTFNIALNFEDGITRFIQCHAGEKVLDAAYRQQVNLPMDCSDGVCGTCKCRCVSGEYGLGDDFLEEALSEDEAAERQVLTCQMVPTSDCVIENQPGARRWRSRREVIPVPDQNGPPADPAPKSKHAWF